MPRPRVAPENRIRAYRACDPCKVSKTRCDSQLPCAACNKPSRVVHCKYSGSSLSSGASSPASSASKRPGRGHHPRSNNTQSHRNPSAVSGGATLGSTSSPVYAAGSTMIPSPSQNAIPGARNRMASTMHAERTAAEVDDPESPQEQLVTGPDGEKRGSYCLYRMAVRFYMTADLHHSLCQRKCFTLLFGLPKT